MSLEVKKSHLPGLDLLRILAALLIFLQHTFSVTGHEEISAQMNMRLGRLGTALLFVMSGFLAASTTQSPEQWLRRRLFRLYPPFWAVLAVGFLGASITGRKDFDFIQLICEFVGIGFYTHSSSIILVTVWFFSLIMTMTFLVYLAHRFGHFLIIGGATAAIAIGAHLSPKYLSEYFGFSMVYLTGYVLAVPVQVSGRWLLPVVALGTMGMIGLPGYRGLLCAIVLLALALRENCPSWRFAARFTPFAYEWFLSHGLCLHLVCLMTKNPWVVLPVAAPLSIAVAIGLHRFVQILVPTGDRNRTI